MLLDAVRIAARTIAWTYAQIVVVNARLKGRAVLAWWSGCCNYFSA